MTRCLPLSLTARCCLLSAFLLLIAHGSVFTVGAQSATATLSGTVTDPNSAAVPAARVTVTNNATGLRRQATTDDSGIFTIPLLPPSTYMLLVESHGFTPAEIKDVVLNVGANVALNIRLTVGQVGEIVDVRSGPPLLETTETALKQVIDSRTIDTMPLNGRNYLDLILLTPGVVVNTQARADLTNRDTNGAIMGERAGNTAYLIDGLNNNDDFHGGVFQAFTQDAIQEFEVIDTGYKAEFGNGSGGIVNVVSKSGTNAIHGNAFLFARNDALDSSNVTGQKPPKLSRYDYGGTFGAPVRRNKAWFFGSFERVQETRGAIFAPNVPASLSAGEDFSRQPETHDVRAFGKYSQKLSDKNELRFSLSWTRSNLQNQLADPIALPSASNSSLTKTWLGTIALTTLFNPQLILDSSFGFRSRNFQQNQGLRLGTSYNIVFLDDGSSFDFGPPAGSIQTLRLKYFTERETLSWIPTERHFAKFGFEYTHAVANGLNGQDLQDVIATTHGLFNLYGVNSFQIPQGVAFLNPGDNISRLHNNGISLFAQDDWRVVPSVMLSGGLRYDYDSTFGATHNIAPRLGLAWSPDKKTSIRASWGIFYDRYRLGIAQPVPEFGGFHGTTVVELDYPRLANDALIAFKGSLGAFAKSMKNPNFLNTQFGIPPGTLVNAGNIQALTGMSPGAFASAVNAYLATFNTPFIPVDFSPSTGFLRENITGSFADTILVAEPFHTPYNRTFSVGVQRELASSLAVGVSFVHRSIRDIMGVRITNLSPQSAIVGAPITTDGGPISRTYGPWYDGQYNGLVLTLDKRFSRRFQFQANYTFARSTDDLLNSNLGLGVATQGGGAVPTNNNDLEFDRGNSDLFVPHVLVASGVVALPFGFQLSGIFRATSGVYFSASGTPTDYDGDGISSTRPVGTKRNQFRGPASVNLDMRIEKLFRFRERYSIAALAEFFNLTNAANPELINNFWTNGAPGTQFGQVQLPLPGREIQFGFRFNF